MQTSIATRIGISPDNLEKAAHILNAVLADEFILYTKTRNAHWNVEGADFFSKHKFFESQYEQLDEIMDDVAERIRALGHYAPATLKDYLKLTHLTEQSRENNDAAGFTKELLADHETIIIHLRENINRLANDLHDAGTSDFITGLMETHEKMAWMLRAHLK
jgi:starvation-inducible DNA-binding protein